MADRADSAGKGEPAGKSQDRRVEIIEAVAWAGEQLLGVGLAEGVGGILERLARGAEVEEAWIWEAVEDEGAVSLHQRYVWCKEADDGGGMAKIDLAAGQSERWLTWVKAGGAVYGQETAGLGRDVSLMVGILAGGRWWGGLGFGERAEPDSWTDAEVDGLSRAAVLLGLAIHRGEEETLQAWEHDLLYELVNGIPTIIVVKDRESRYVFANARSAHASQVADPAEMIGKTDSEVGFLSKERAEQFHQESVRVMETGESLVDRDVMLRQDEVGRDMWLSTTKIPWREPGGEIIGTIGVTYDITDRKQAEEAVKYRIAFEELISSLSTRFINLNADETDAGIDYALAAVGKFADVDRSYVFQYSDAERSTFRNTNEWCGVGIEAHLDTLGDIPSSTLPWWTARMNRFEVIHISRVADLGEEARAEKAIFEEQEIKSLVTVPIVYSGQLMGFLGFDSVRSARGWHKTDVALLQALADIIANALQRQRAEALRKESEERYRAVFEGAPDGILIADAETKRFQYANPAICHMLGYGEEELKGMGIGNIHPEKDLPHVVAEFEAQVRGEKSLAPELPCLCKDGRVIYADIRSTPIVIGDRGCVVGIFTDITERRKSQDALKASLAEKEVLLKEVHHRVKNNLQVISSLLNLHMQEAPEGQADVLAECQRQVYAIALIHEKLHQSESVAKVNFAQYVRSLVVEMARSFGSSADVVNYTMEVDDVSIDLDRAMPCGLILNEALSNVFKHAFPDGRKGKVVIRLARVGRNKIEVLVQDDGVGIAEDFDMNATGTLGLRLVAGLVRQLRGEMELVRDNGTVFRVTFVNE